MYGQSSRLATIPSSPCAREAASIASPSPTWWAGACHVGPESPSSASLARRAS